MNATLEELQQRIDDLEAESAHLRAALRDANDRIVQLLDAAILRMQAASSKVEQ